MRELALLFLLAIAAALPAGAQGTDADALKLLDTVARQYEEASSLHFEATIEHRIHGYLYEQQYSEVLSAYQASGGRFRYEGRNHSGSGLIVSNGIDEWRLLRSFGQYVKEPAGTYFAGRRMLQGDDASVNDAEMLTHSLNYLTASTRAAHFGADETLTIDGKRVSCKVVHFSLADTAHASRSRVAEETTLWIDPANFTLRKLETHRVGPYWYGNVEPPHGPDIEDVSTTLYRIAELNFEPHMDTFLFTPPNDAKEVAELPAPFPKPAGGSANEPTAAEKVAAEHLNQPLPNIGLVDSNGQGFYLSRYLGHPLLIDLWATWCAPCVNELPLLAAIRKSTALTDLKIVGIDEDDQHNAPGELLKRRGYDWEDFHYTHALTKALPSPGIPLLVLVDAAGKIVYYHTGVGDAKGLTAAIARLGPAYQTVNAGN